MNALKVAAVFAVMFTFANPAFSQVLSRTLIVMYAGQEKVVVAADSFETIYTVDTGVVDKKNHCKVAALGNKIIFFATGMFGYSRRTINDALLPDWTPWGEAVNAYEGSLSPTPEQLARKWGDVVANHINSEVRASVSRRQAVEKVSREYGGGPGQAIFVSAPTSKEIQIYYVHIAYDPKDFFYPAYSVITPYACGAPDRPYCAFGLPPEELHEYFDLTTERARNEVSKWPANDEVFGTKRMVELGIQYDKTGILGGSIDVAVLPRNGTVQWAANPNCK